MARKTSKSETPDQKPLYILITESREHGYFHLYGRVVTQKYEHSEWMPYGVDDDYSDGLLWSGLQLRCQGDEQSRSRAAEGLRDAPVYGFDCEYHEVWGLGLRKARRILKTLEHLDKKLAKIDELRGRVTSYGEYVGRIAEAFGCAGIGFKRDARSYNGQQYEWVTVGYGVNQINHRIAMWQEEGKPKREEALPAAGMREGEELLRDDVN